MNYLSAQQRQVFNQFTAWVPQPLAKTEKLIDKIRRYHESPSENAHTTLHVEILTGLSHMYERRNMALKALEDPRELAALYDLYPNVRAHALRAGRPNSGLLAMAIDGYTEEFVQGARAMFDNLLGALSQVPKTKEAYLVFTNAGPTKVQVDKAWRENKNPILSGIAIPANAQKVFIETFNKGRNVSYLNAILKYDLLDEDTITGSVPVSFVEVKVPGFPHAPAYQLEYRGHRATVFVGT